MIIYRTTLNFNTFAIRITKQETHCMRSDISNAIRVNKQAMVGYGS